MKNDKRLWNPDTFIVYSVFFSFYPAAIMYALNYGRMGDKEKQNKYLLNYTLAFILVLALGYFLPVKNTSGAFLGASIAAGMLMKRDQKPKYLEAVETNGKASTLPILAVCLVISSALLWLIIFSRNIPDKKIDYKSNVIFYMDSVAEADARRLGDYLYGSKFMDEKSDMLLKLDKAGEYYIFSMALNKKSMDLIKKDKDSFIQKNKDDFTKIGSAISKNVFDGKEVKVELCDEVFRRLVIFP